MTNIQASLDLLIGQWQGSPALRALIQAFIEGMKDDLDEAAARLQLMRAIDTGEGVFLDAIGERLGVERPYVADRAQDPRFGFDDTAVGFDIAPYRGAGVNDAVFPMPDAEYRRLLKARSVLMFSDGSFETFAYAALFIDETATVQDPMSMTVRIITNESRLFRAADACGALPRTAGVALEYRDRQRFGFDGAGVPFDAGPYLGA